MPLVYKKFSFAYVKTEMPLHTLNISAWGLQPSLKCESRNTSMVLNGRPLSLVSSPLPFSNSVGLRCGKPWCSNIPTLPLPLSGSNLQRQLVLPNANAAIQANLHGSVLENSDNFASDCELYVCNLPRSCGISELLEIFHPYGTVQSVEVSRNAETGMSRGCGYITMSSIREAKAAIAALDGSDVSGREMRVGFSAEMSWVRNNSDLQATNLAAKRNLVFESPYKIYLGNLAWSVTPSDLRNLFSQFGILVSARVLHDRKAGSKRVYGFLSFSSPGECKAAMSLNGIVKFVTHSCS